MAKRTVRIVENKRGLAAFRRDIARGGFAAVILDAELEAKRETPVRGGYRSFRPGTKPIGGTLRRSVHSVVFLDGALVAGHSEDGKAPLDVEFGIPGRIVGYVGTNSGYGAYVDLGTAKMAARPFLYPGLEVAARRAAGTFRAGMARVGRV